VGAAVGRYIRAKHHAEIAGVLGKQDSEGTLGARRQGSGAEMLQAPDFGELAEERVSMRYEQGPR
jgi:hypothetical protein